MEVLKHKKKKTENVHVLDEEGPQLPPNNFLPFLHLFWVFLCLLFMVAIVLDLVIGNEVVIVPSIIKFTKDIFTFFLTYKGITFGILYLIIVVTILYIALIVKKRQQLSSES